jgi:dihydroorotate dehydrogenase
MPDWFYRTVSRPLLFRLPAEVSRTFALRIVGTLSRLPLGPGIIDLLGHMRADPRLKRTILGIEFPTAVGLGPGLDGEAIALPALARFGFGFLEVGPVRIEPSRNRPILRLPDQHAISYPDGFNSPGLAQFSPRIDEASRLGVPIIVRLDSAAGEHSRIATESCCRIIESLAPRVQIFSLATLRRAVRDRWRGEEWGDHLRDILEAAGNFSSPRSLLLCVPADSGAEYLPLIEIAIAAGINGLLLDGAISAETDSLITGAPARQPALRTVRELRARWNDLPIIGSGGIHQPEDALEMLDAGADLLQIDSGLVYTGPGLPKWTNDAILFATIQADGDRSQTAQPERTPEMTWFWTALLGAAMMLGSILALIFAATKVVLPYDEAFVGLTRDQLGAINTRLLPFMSHDRVTLAGTMVAIGALYLMLSLNGIRRGLHWAQKSVFVSAFVGFGSFFLFLGFGYLDTFHAFVTLCMLQLLLLGVHSKRGEYRPAIAPYLRENSAMRAAHWGQLLLIIHASGLIIAGLFISAIGVTSVFVPEDLAFMKTTAEALCGVNPHLGALVAHDRATLGGMLLSSGLAFLLPTLWGFRNGSRWLWWTFAVAGISAYAAAIGVHGVVGYLDFRHLLPAFAGLGLFLLGLGVSYRYLCGTDKENEKQWRKFLTATNEGNL